MDYEGEWGEGALNTPGPLNDPGSIPGGGKLNACPLPGGQLTSTHYSQYMPVLRIRDPVPF
jgi:hypothetical protein